MLGREAGTAHDRRLSREPFRRAVVLVAPERAGAAFEVGYLIQMSQQVISSRSNVRWLDRARRNDPQAFRVATLGTVPTTHAAFEREIPSLASARDRSALLGWLARAEQQLIAVRRSTPGQWKIRPVYHCDTGRKLSVSGKLQSRRTTGSSIRSDKFYKHPLVQISAPAKPASRRPRSRNRSDLGDGAALTLNCGIAEMKKRSASRSGVPS